MVLEILQLNEITDFLVKICLYHWYGRLECWE